MKVKYIEETFYVSGLTTRTKNENEMEEETAKIGPLWQKYADETIDAKTFNKAKSMAMYGLYHNYESDVTGEYDYTIGVEVTKPKNALKIEKQRYLVFKKEGELPDVVISLWADIWEYFSSEACEYERAYNIDFEKYTKEDEIEIYISIK